MKDELNPQLVDMYEKIYNATFALNRLRNRLSESELMYKSAEAEAELTEIEMILQYNIQSSFMPVLKDLVKTCPDIKEKEIKIPKACLLNYEPE